MIVSTKMNVSRYSTQRCSGIQGNTADNCLFCDNWLTHVVLCDVSDPTWIILQIIVKRKWKYLMSYFTLLTWKWFLSIPLLLSYSRKKRISRDCHRVVYCVRLCTKCQLFCLWNICSVCAASQTLEILWLSIDCIVRGVPCRYVLIIKCVWSANVAFTLSSYYHQTFITFCR